MKITGALLLASMLALALVAPEAYPQKRSDKDMLNDLTIDVIELKNSLRLLQESIDQKNTAVMKLVEQAIDRLNTNVGKLGESLTGIRADNEKSAREVQDVRTLVNSIKGNVSELNEGLTGLSNQLRSVSQQVTALKTTEEPLPSAAALWGQAYSDYSGGLYAIAVTEFKDLLTQYPNDPRAAAALVYIGKSYAAQKQYDQAIVVFDEALQKYPSSDKTCLALYEKGQTQLGQKKIPEAKITLQRVAKDCLGTPEAASANTVLKGLPAR